MAGIKRNKHITGNPGVLSPDKILRRLNAKGGNHPGRHFGRRLCRFDKKLMPSKRFADKTMMGTLSYQISYLIKSFRKSSLGYFTFPDDSNYEP